MRLLLASGGIKNPTIKDALVGMLDKPIAECDALFIPTAECGHPRVHAGPGLAVHRGRGHGQSGLKVGGGT